MEKRNYIKTNAELVRELIDLLEAHKRPIIRGSPGVGKTATIEAALTRRFGKPVVTVIGSMSDPTDIAGFPVMVDGAIKFVPRDFLVHTLRGGGFIFLDEITSAPPSVRAVLLQLAQGLKVGDFALDPKKVGLIAAYNPADIAVNGTDLEAPTVNRYVHLDYPEGPEACLEWCEDVVNNWGVPLPDLEFHDSVIPADVIRTARAWVAAFLGSRPNLWLALPKDADARSLPWPSPRAWTNAADCIAVTVHRGRKPIAALPKIAGAVGDGAAAEFSDNLLNAALPDPNVLLGDPKGYKPTGRPDVDSAVLDSVAAAAAGRPSPERLLAAATIVSSHAVKTGKTMRGAEPAVPAFNRLAKHVEETVRVGAKAHYDPETVQKFLLIQSDVRKALEEAKASVVRK